MRSLIVLHIQFPSMFVHLNAMAAIAAKMSIVVKNGAIDEKIFDMPSTQQLAAEEIPVEQVCEEHYLLG